MAAIGRPRTFDRHAALEAAMRVFWRKGFVAASMKDLCEAMGIASPSLYAAFGSKEALYLEAFDHYGRNLGPPVWGQLAQGKTARDGVRAALLAMAETLPESAGSPSGCMVMLGGAGDEWPEPVADAARQLRVKTLGMIRDRLDAGMAQGDLSPSTNTDRLSRLYLGVSEGMAIQARDGASSEDLRGIAEAAMAAWPD